MVEERKPEDEFPTLREDEPDPAFERLPVEPPDDPDTNDGAHRSGGDDRE
ncbi:MAG: hypothetical protein JOZ99_14935 [Actinobacteria bacterium]|nr:hypothetical protein [Actinomycetota bacterium]